VEPICIAVAERQQVCRSDQGIRHCLTVAKGLMDTLPERLCQGELFDVVPAGWSLTQVDLVGILDITENVHGDIAEGQER
jgi:hypothetical protein